MKIPRLPTITVTACLAIMATQAKAGIPEPDMVWFGTVSSASGGASVRVTTGTLVWQIEPVGGGPAIVLATQLTNINDQFSYVLRVPCETPEPGVQASTTRINLSTPPARYRRLTVTLDGQALSLASAANEFSPRPADRSRVERIDLRLGAISLDADGDGLADAWEQQHFGGLSANPHDDPDGDGIDNLHEYRAGTNPRDAQSRFELVEISSGPSGVSVRWSSQPGQSYRVRRSANLLAAPAAYEVVRGGLVATPPMNEFIDAAAAGGRQFFYLIELEQ